MGGTLETQTSQDKNLFTQHGKASALPQYDNVSILMFQVTNLKNQLRVQWYNNYTTIPQYFNIFSEFFGVLYDTTKSVVSKTRSKKDSHLILTDELKTRFESFFYTPMDSRNISDVHERAEEGLKLHDIYIDLLALSGFERLGIFTLSEESVWRKNF